MVAGLGKRRASITGLYCSQKGHVYTSDEVHRHFAQQVFQGAPAATVALYEKLLLRRPERRRHYLDTLENITAHATVADKFARFNAVAMEWMVDACRGVFAQTGRGPREIDFLVVNYMAGKTLPSLAARLAHALGCAPEVVSFTLGDMGCSAGLASLDLAVRLLAAERRPRRALVVSLEPVSVLFQVTDNPGGIVGNTLFGEGCSAVVVSSHPEPALYHVGPTRRVLKADEDGLRAIELCAGETGPMIQLSQELGRVAGEAVTMNLTGLVPRFLPVVDKLRYLLTRRIPRWQRRVDRWALHPGGTAVLTALQQNLKLADADLGPSYRVFAERSNMSSPAVFYALENIEKAAPRRGERVLMMSFGSGFKVVSALLTRGSKPSPQAPERNAVVVGGTSGIGLAAARVLERHGYRVFIGSRRVGAAADGFPRLATASYFPLDVTSAASIAAFAEQVFALTYGIDVLVVSAGVAPAAAAVGRVDPEVISRTVSTNLTGAMLAVNGLLPKLRAPGRIILLNSLLGQIPLMGSAVYGATKAGLRHFAACLEVDLRRAGRRITVHSLFPAYVDTPMLRAVRESGRLLLEPVAVEEVARQIEHIIAGHGPRDGFTRARDRVIAGLYRWFPGAFRRVLAEL